MASVTGSRLAFFAGVDANLINVALTSDGTTVAAPIPGLYNIEVFTTAAGTLAAGYDAGAFIGGAVSLTNNAVQAGSINSIEELLAGSYTLIDLAGGSARGEAIQVKGDSGDSYVVVGSAGDTITGSTDPSVSQKIDASGSNNSANPGPFQGPETIRGGAGGTTVIGGKGDEITGGAGALQVNDGTLAGDETVIAGAGNLFVFGIGKNFSVTGSTAGTTIINDQYGGGGNSSIVGGSGTTLLPGGENTQIFAAAGDAVTVGTALTYVDAALGSVTVQGGSGTATGTIEGASGFNTVILAGPNDVIRLGSASTYVSALSVGGATVATAARAAPVGLATATITAGSGFAHIDAGAGASIKGGSGKLEVNAEGGGGTITGGSGSLFVFDIGRGEVVTGATAGTTYINDAYGSGGKSSLTGGSGTVTGAGGLAVNTLIIGAPGDTITGYFGTTSINGIAGSQSIVAGPGATTVQAGDGDTITGGSGQLQVMIDSDQPTTTINLGTAHGPATLVDVSVAGGKGGALSVTGFSTDTDIIQSQTSDGATLRATSTKDADGDVVLHFADGSTITLAGVTDVTKISFGTRQGHT